MVSVLMKNHQLFPLMLLIMMPFPGLCLSCIKCIGADCEMPDASKGTPCTDEKFCLIYGAPGSIIRGCANEAQKKCVKNLIGDTNCYFGGDGPLDTKAKVEACLKEGPGNGTLGTDMKICYCEKDNCNKGKAAAFLGRNEVYGPFGYMGTLMKKIKCYDCTGEPGSACADGNVKKIKHLIKDCEGICSTRVTSKSVSRTCNPFTNEIYECLKDIIGLCVEETKQDEAAKEKERQQLEELRLCLANHGIEFDFNQFAMFEGQVPQDIKSECYCASDLCNPAGHSSPNKKLVIAVMVAVYLSLLKL